MASPEVLDFERLLAAVSDDSPAGAELKEDPALSAAYYEVKDAREAARAAERKMVQAAWADDDDDMMAIDVTPPDWRAVIRISCDTLAEKSKDLWVAAWLIEGLAREEGFAGLRDGFRLVREISERFWENIHPHPDEDGYSTTVAQLTGLNGDDAEGALLQPITAIPIVSCPSEGELSSADYLQAADLLQVSDPEIRERRVNAGAITMAKFESLAGNTSVEFYRNLLDDAQQALEEFNQLTSKLEELCGEQDGYPQAPPSTSIKKALEECCDRIRVISKDVLGVADAANEVELVEGVGGELVSAGEGVVGSTEDRVMNRESAFEMLRKIADFFEHTEPHSPVSYSLRQVVSWGKMSLPQLLAELISDQQTLDELSKRAGIPMSDAESD